MAVREFSYKDFQEIIERLLGLRASKDRIYRWLRHPRNPLPATLVKVDAEDVRGKWVADETELKAWAGSFAREETKKTRLSEAK